MKANINNMERIMKDLELFYFIKKEVIPMDGRYYLLGLWTLSQFLSRPSIERLIEGRILKRLGLFRKQPRKIQIILNNQSRFSFTRSRSRATILWEVDYRRLILLIQERENALLERYLD